MTRTQAKETLLKLMRMINNAYDNNEKFEIPMDEDEFIEDVGDALDIAIADMDSLQEVINCVDGILNQ